MQTGMGVRRAWASAQAVLQEPVWDFVIATGVAGALIPSQIGNLVVSTEIIMDGEYSIHEPFQPQISCDARFLQPAATAAAGTGLLFHQGPVVTVSTVLCTANEKQCVAERWGGIAVDMESVAVGNVAFNQRIPFLMIRAVSDAFDEDLPVDFNLFHGTLGWARGLWAILSRPAVVLDLLKFKRQTDLALNSLSKFFSVFWGQLHRDRDKLFVYQV